MSPAAVEKNILHRVNAYIKNGWDKQLVDPDNQHQPAERIAPFTPTDGWQDLKCTAPVMKSLDFSNSQLATQNKSKHVLMPICSASL